MILQIFLFACNNSVKDNTPEILTAEYEIKSYNQTEQGFSVFMVIDKIPKSTIVKSVILKNHRFDKIISTQMTTTEIFIDQFFPVNSQTISDFVSPATDNRTDGIVFERDGQEFFKEITFKLKTEK